MFEYSLGVMCLSIAILYGWKNTYQDTSKVFNLRKILICIFLTVSLGINKKLPFNFLKFIISNLIMYSGNKLLYKRSIKKTILSVLSTEIAMIIADISFGLGTLSFSTFTEKEVIVDKYFGASFTNIVISTLIFIMTLFNVPLSICKKLTIKMEKNSNKQMIIIMTLVVITINILFSSIYYQMPLIISMILNTIIMIIYGYIILRITNERNENLKTFEKYKKTAEALNEYQDAVNKYRVDRHENKNQLETIEKMAMKTNNNEILNYVQTLLEKKKQNNPKIKLEDIVIPDGWLKTTLYSKIEIIEKNKIKFILDIDRQVKSTDLIDIDESTMLDICNILNIFIDNAIEAITPSSNSYIKIRFYKEEKNNLNISVINSCKNIVEVDKIGMKGYSNKGEGRGYGLAFVKETIKNNRKLTNEKIVKVGSFTQILKIKGN